MKRSRCKHCGDFITWARRENSDRFIPMNADSVPTGTHVLMGWDDPPVACAVGAGELAFDDVRERYTVHDCLRRARSA